MTTRDKSRRETDIIRPMRVLADEAETGRLVDELARRVAEAMAGHADADWAIVGIRSRGDTLAKRLAERLGPQRLDGRVGTLDITLYRDDLSEVANQPVVRTTEIPFDIGGLHVVLVDDVLMTGRSIRAAVQQLIDLGRPRRVWLAVLVDRGGRELPIAPDLVALDLTSGNTPLGANDSVQVRLRPMDDRDAIVVQARGEKA